MKWFSALFLAAIVGLGLTLGAPIDGPAAAHAAGLDLEALPAIAAGGLVINAANLTRVYTGFKTAFNRGLGQVPPQHERLATRVPSTTKEEKYGWLGKIPGVREWVGERVVHSIALHDYTIKNKKFELTIGVPRDDIEDDTYGVYAPMFEEMGQSVAAHPSELVFGLLKAGFSTACYDGQYFFDTDHPVLDEDGNVTSVANTDGGAGTPWFLVDDTRALKPILFQERRKWEFVSFTDPKDENVFWKDEFVYGGSGRYNVGFGFWQFAWGSRQTLDKANYKTAREALMGMKGDYGRPLNVRPRLLVVPPSLEGEALEIVNAERDSAGATNVYKGTAEVLVAPWLA